MRRTLLRSALLECAYASADDLRCVARMGAPRCWRGKPRVDAAMPWACLTMSPPTAPMSASSARGMHACLFSAPPSERAVPYHPRPIRAGMQVEHKLSCEMYALVDALHTTRNLLFRWHVRHPEGCKLKPSDFGGLRNSASTSKPTGEILSSTHIPSAEHYVDSIPRAATCNLPLRAASTR